MATKISVIRFRLSPGQPWEFHRESLSVAAAKEFARTVELAGGEATVFTFELSDAELIEIAERKASHALIVDGSEKDSYQVGSQPGGSSDA